MAGRNAGSLPGDSAISLNYVKGDPAEIPLQKAVTELCDASGGSGTFLWAPFFLSSLGMPCGLQNQ